jgi:CheY-like chemotaxis protein
VIDDNADGAESLRAVLELDGHTAEVAHDGPQGLTRGREFRPEVVLCDIGLPGADGYQVARAMRQDPVLRGAFLIALTGYTRPDDQKLAAEAGFDAYLSKPASVEQLRETVARAGPGARP